MMSIPVFQNTFPYDIDVPTFGGGTTVVPPGRYVKGTYFLILAAQNLLTQVQNPDSIPLTLIEYEYPEEGIPTTFPPGPITSVIAGQGLAGGGDSGDITLSIGNAAVTNAMLAGSITASKIASGQLVKSVNGLFDDVTLAEGANITVTVNGQTITIDGSAGGLVSALGTAPLILGLDVTGTQLTGSIAVTPTDDGGAVALQAGPAYTKQTGAAFLSAYYTDFLGIGVDAAVAGTSAVIKNIMGNTLDFLRFLKDDGTTLGKIGPDGSVTLYGTAVLMAPNVVTDSLLIGENLMLPNAIVLAATISLSNVLTLVTGGQIAGTVGAIPLIALQTASPTVAALSVRDTNDTPAALVLQSLDKNGATLARLYGPGIFECQQIRTKNQLVGPRLLTAGAYTLDETSGTAFFCDASAGPITINLPVLTPTSPSTLLYYFKRVDNVVGNGVLVSAQGSQPIDGQLSILLANQYDKALLGNYVSNSNSFWSRWV